MKCQKKIFTALTAAVLIGSLSACGNTQTAEETSPQPAETDSEKTPAESAETITDSASAEETAGSHVLVIYFSRTGEQYTVGVIEHDNTAIAAEMIAEETGADLFEVLPEDDHYPMTYEELTDVAKREQSENARPAYAGDLPELAGYDTVFIGSPVWWGDWPMIMYTLFENNDFSGKTLIPFSTNEGSGLAGFDKKLKEKCPSAVIGKGLAIRGSDCQNAQEKVRKNVNSWLSELGF